MKKTKKVLKKGMGGYGKIKNRPGGRKNKKAQSGYAEAKKKDPKLDEYIATRNKHPKGSADYIEAQNKINAAYGKGPTDREFDSRGGSNSPERIAYQKQFISDTPKMGYVSIKDKKTGKTVYYDGDADIYGDASMRMAAYDALGTGMEEGFTQGYVGEYEMKRFDQEQKGTTPVAKLDPKKPTQIKRPERSDDLVLPSKEVKFDSGPAKQDPVKEARQKLKQAKKDRRAGRQEDRKAKRAGKQEDRQARKKQRFMDRTDRQDKRLVEKAEKKEAKKTKKVAKLQRKIDKVQGSETTAKPDNQAAQNQLDQDIKMQEMKGRAGIRKMSTKGRRKKMGGGYLKAKAGMSAKAEELVGRGIPKDVVKRMKVKPGGATRMGGDMMPKGKGGMKDRRKGGAKSEFGKRYDRLTKRLEKTKDKSYDAASKFKTRKTERLDAKEQRLLDKRRKIRDKKAKKEEKKTQRSRKKDQKAKQQTQKVLAKYQSR